MMIYPNYRKKNLQTGPIYQWKTIVIANPTSPPSDWTNITLNIPDYACSVQTTAKYFVNYSILTEETIYYAVSYWDYTFHTSIVWWSKPWILSIGWALC